MRKRPIIFTVVSLLCLIEPVIKVLYLKSITGFDFLLIFKNLSSRNTFIEVVDFWFIFPIAGALILKLRKWTYFSFIAVLSYINFNIFTYEKYTWPYNSDAPFMYNYVVAFLSIGMIVYFLFPKVRQPFFDRRIRWWEPKIRYDVDISCKLHGKHLTFPVQIFNLSQSGAFISDSQYINVGETYQMSFNFFGEDISLPIQVVNKHNLKDQSGYGIKFKFTSLKQSALLKRIINILKRTKTQSNGDSKTSLVA